MNYPELVDVLQILVPHSRALARRPLRSRLRTHQFSTKSGAEQLCMFALGKAEDAEVGTIAIERMPAVTQAQLPAEKTVRQVIVSATAVACKRHLMRPAPVDGRFG